jgi:hypothetical protein
VQRLQALLDSGGCSPDYFGSQKQQRPASLQAF